MSIGDFQNETLQVKRLRHRQENGMIGSLDPPFDHTDPATGIPRALREHPGKDRLGHVVRTAACNKDAARPEKPHRPQIDLFVSPQRTFETLLVAGESRRVENDRVVLLALVELSSEKVENVFFDAADILNAVAFNIALGKLDGGPGQIDRLDGIADPGEVQRKPSAVAETVESASLSIASGGAMILPLIEVSPRFLARFQRDFHLPSVFFHDGKGWWSVADPLAVERKPLEFTDLGIVSQKDGARTVTLLQQPREDRLQTVRCLCQALNDKVVAVPVDDESRQEIRLRINAPAQTGIDSEPGSQVVGLLKARAEKRLVDDRFRARQESESDLRSGAVEGRPDDSAVVANHDHRTGLGAAIVEDIAAIDPEMPCANAGRTMFPDQHLSLYHRRRSMLLSDFDYELPPERIAREPVEPRDASRLMVLADGRIADERFRNLPELLRPSDVLVLNDTRVLKARMTGRLERRNGTSREMEVFFAEPAGKDTWQVLCKPGRRIRPGDRVVFGSGEVQGTFRDAVDNELHVLEIDAAEEMLARYGQIPLPPYIDRLERASDETSYQTVFAAHAGAVAAPTAGLHFTREVLDAIASRGIEVVHLTLHVGIGTFLPVRTDRPEEHVLRAERFELQESAAKTLREAVRTQRRVVAVGTTTTRVMEYLMMRDGEIRAGSGKTDLFILPGFKFRIVGGLLTNFHLPRSTLLMLVSAFSGRENILRAYRHAIREGYRFYSYGDCMLLEH